MFRMAMLLLCMTMAACSGGKTPTQAAPVGDKAVLESLADQYNKLSEDLPVSPWHLKASARKDFVEKVFAASGYSYSATLHQMAQGGWDPNDQNAKALVNLMFMPHTDLHAGDGLKGVYSEQEMADVRKVQKMMP